MQFFAQFGEIVEGAVILDRNTGKSKGFAFVTFANIDEARAAIDAPDKNLDVSL